MALQQSWALERTHTFEDMRLSERLGIVAVRARLQGRSLDTPTRNRLWSAVATVVPEDGTLTRYRSSWMRALYAHVWADFYKEPVDDIPSQEEHVRAVIRQTFLEGEWWDVYDLIEFLIESPHNGNRDRLRSAVALILNEEMAGFRYVAGQFVEITDETEISAIEDAIAATSMDRFTPARAHLITGLQLLSDRKSPDYRNSIKESISSVEAIAQILTRNSQAELGEALKLLRTKAPIHGALRRALLALYGYTSDADGIRHALTEEPDLDAADAKFMLVACSAFVVYLIQKATS